ncbi:hypothetical protein [Streptomyces sp. NPDC048606]|uniref:hypothetical protein n=1 Tax=Streptomyces sp. NPDC048606 TaxID=3154726 RepID=UPI003429FB81
MSSMRPHGFEERLKSALLARLPQAPAPRPSFARRFGIPCAVGLATAAVIGVVFVPGGGRETLPASRPGGEQSPPVPVGQADPVKAPDGSIRFRLPKPYGVLHLADRLTQLGVTTVVVPVVPPSDCPGAEGGRYGPQKNPGLPLARRDADGFVFTVDQETVPPGHTLMFTWADGYPPTGEWVAVQVIETARIPNGCVVDDTYLTPPP